jgi:aryl-alcohol dehydrogenase-like predicted oxidoreductase
LKENIKTAELVLSDEVLAGIERIQAEIPNPAP